MREFCGCTFTKGTAVCSEFKADGRQDAILLHDLSDELHDGDTVYFDTDMPENEEEAKDILLYCYDKGYTDSDTLDTFEEDI